MLYILSIFENENLILVMRHRKLKSNSKAHKAQLEVKQTGLFKVKENLDLQSPTCRIWNHSINFFTKDITPFVHVFSKVASLIWNFTFLLDFGLN